MCGILGEISPETLKLENWKKACHSQNHRGPDNNGDWYGQLNDWKISLAHQCLSILDLSTNGSQPMLSKDSSSILVFNGEIYNYIELKLELESCGKIFESSSDTEVLLEALDEWGIEETQKKLNGMWAFAWYDTKNKKVFLSRDRTGEKPLYVNFKDNTLRFSSELRSLLFLNNKKFNLNFQKIYEFLKFGLIDSSDETYFKGITQVKPGTFSSYGLDSEVMNLEVESYWECPVKGKENQEFPEFCSELRDDFIDSVKLRLRSDVPVGILLSGGIDSTAIAGAAKELGAKDITLLSYISDDPKFDESGFIRIAAEYLKFPLIEVSLPKEPSKLFKHLVDATNYMDGPVGSFGNISHYLLMKAAKEKGITVILSGQGADELFCGYKKYLGFYMIELFKKGLFVKSISIFLGFIFNKSIINQFNISQAKRYLPFLNKRKHFYGANLLNLLNPDLSLGPDNSVSKRQLKDLKKFSIPSLNHSEDRMSMAWSREIRLPFLDKRIIEKAIPAPTNYKIKNGWTKFALRHAVKDFIPTEISWRKDKK